MNSKVPILDVVLVLATVGAALSPWPWSALLVAAAYFAVVAFIIDRREAPPPTPEEPHP